MRHGAVLLSLLGLSGLSGCWFRFGGGTGSVQLSWSFNGGQNCRSAGVTQLEVAGAGPTVYLPCVDIPGSTLSTATLPAVPAGAQTFVLSGVGPVYDPDAGTAFPQAAYQGTFTFDISEASINITAPVDLAPTDPKGVSGDLLLLWTIERGDCDGAGISQIQFLNKGTARLDPDFRVAYASTDAGSVPCKAEGGFEGMRIVGLSPGIYSVPMWGEGRNSYTYAAAPAAYVTGHTETVQHVDLHNTLQENTLVNEMDLTLRLAIDDGGTCQSSGIQIFKVDLKRSEVNGIGAIINGAPASVDVQLARSVDLAFPCSYALGPGIPIHNFFLDPRPCSGVGMDGGSCPITVGEYHLSVQGLTEDRTAYVLGDYDLWIDQGLINGVPAGRVPEYGQFLNGNLIPAFTNFYVVPVPAVSP